ncbi:Arylsulfatase [Pontiella desulfatans]|uniref:Arylsulfatase n=1 Tax=Pontiella desulfatans TaxID=2750659 RepID=A0A6C2U1R8_PONDE|nr:arylsulfatase [Pontiella desulfatans]SPS73866.1 sulfatase S1_15 [Kiritimatiellales bacterium]VGO13827.1 Arylsulfatase [Pontiella desulfatans]
MSRIVAWVLAGLVSASVAAPRPNIVLIYGDDVGFGDVGAYGSEMIPTPNIDRLAAEGLRFTDGHCTSATCSPSRFSMLTGVYAFRHKVSILPPNAPLSIPTDITTLPKMLQRAGYKTGVIGKWHLGIGAKEVPTDWNGAVKPGPLEIGFDYSFLLPSTNDRVPCVYLKNHHVVGLDPKDPLFVERKLADVRKHAGSTQYPDAKETPEAMTYYKSSHGHNNSVINGIGRIGFMAGGASALWNDETMADEFVKEAKNYIAENKDRPFFLYFASQDIHVPRAPHPRFQGSTQLGYRGDAMVQFDWSTGEIMKALEENGLTENTIVIFSSDNGPVYDDGYDDGTVVKTSSEEVDRGHDGSGIWRGGKYQIYEGGTRVPFIVRWPARIKPGVSAALVNQVDLMGSFAALLGEELADDEGIDSRNTLAALLGEERNGLPFMVEEAGGKRALRRGEWKYIQAYKHNKKGVPAQLFNLANDPGEQDDLIKTHPEKAEAMAGELEDLLKSKRMR